VELWHQSDQSQEGQDGLIQRVIGESPLKMFAEGSGKALGDFQLIAIAFERQVSNLGHKNKTAHFTYQNKEVSAHYKVPINKANGRKMTQGKEKHISYVKHSVK
jgi:hypothetical protein